MAIRLSSRLLTMTLGVLAIAVDEHSILDQLDRELDKAAQMLENIDSNQLFFNQQVKARQLTSDYSYIFVEPTYTPTASPSDEPSAIPSSKPTYTPTVSPSVEPSALPTGTPSYTPSSSAPSYAPSISAMPTPAPSVTPIPTFTPFPSIQPSTSSPSFRPTDAPSDIPTASPSGEPTVPPTGEPTIVPSSVPTVLPSKEPTGIPSSVPTAAPSTSEPSAAPSYAPTILPSSLPTFAPSTYEPTAAPSTSEPSAAPSTSAPSAAPSVSSLPTSAPSVTPIPTFTPFPSPQPSTSAPSLVPTSEPTMTPSSAPTSVPTTAQPSPAPTREEFEFEVSTTFFLAPTQPAVDTNEAVDILFLICADEAVEQVILNYTKEAFEPDAGSLGDTVSVDCDISNSTDTSGPVGSVPVVFECTIQMFRSDAQQPNPQVSRTAFEARDLLADLILDKVNGTNSDEAFIDDLIFSLEASSDSECLSNLELSVSELLNQTQSPLSPALSTSLIEAVEVSEVSEEIEVAVETSSPTSAPTFAPSAAPTEIPTFVPTITNAPTEGTAAPTGQACRYDSDCPPGQTCEGATRRRVRKRKLLFGYGSGICK